jgi:hypothetical protein
MAHEFKDGDVFRFDLSNEEDCKFLFGECGGAVYNLSKIKTPKVNARISKVDVETNTIYLEPAEDAN